MKVQVSLKVYKSDFESLIKTDTQKDVTLYVELNNIKSLKKILFTHKNCLNKEILLMTLLKRNKKHECKTLILFHLFKGTRMIPIVFLLSLKHM